MIQKQQIHTEMEPEKSGDSQLWWRSMPFSIDGVDLSISAVQHRELKGRPPVLFLHGFGGTKEDYTDFSHLPLFSHYSLLAYDAPGCGTSTCSDPSAISIPLLVQTAVAVLDQAGVDKFHLVGHSMGGLTALMLAHKHPDRVLSFVNIKGNLAPEDCFLSRQIFAFPSQDPAEFLEHFLQRTANSGILSAALYTSSLRHKVDVRAIAGIFTSMVELSDTGDLKNKFLRLPFPKMFMFGEQNRTLSYLPDLKANGVHLAEIALSGHFPMYSNPPAMWSAMAHFWEVIAQA